MVIRKAPTRNLDDDQTNPLLAGDGNEEVIGQSYNHVKVFMTDFTQQGTQ